MKKYAITFEEKRKQAIETLKKLGAVIDFGSVIQESLVEQESVKLVSTFEDAVVFNSKFNTKSMLPSQRLEYAQAMNDLLMFGITQNNPIPFRYRRAWDIVIQEFDAHNQEEDAFQQSWCDRRIETLKQNDMIKKVFFRNIEVELPEFVCNLAGSINAKKLLAKNPLELLLAYQEGKIEINNLPINSSFISAWCDAAHIVGFAQSSGLQSEGEEVKDCQLFDSKKIKDERKHGALMAKIIEDYGAIITDFKGVISAEMSEFLLTANPAEIMQEVKKDPKCKELFDLDAGIWEKWTVGQHTESVIDFFDRYFSDTVPKELIPFIKIAMLAHDIGKGVAVQKGVNQTQENVIQSDNLFNTLGIEENYVKLIKFMISDSQKYTTSILRGNGALFINEVTFKHACENALYEAFGRVPKKEEIDAFKRVCVVLQQCDSGAYTFYAQIREGDKMVTGGNESFTESFILDENNNPRLRNFEGLHVDNM